MKKRACPARIFFSLFRTTAVVFISLWLAFPASFKPLSDSSLTVPPVLADFDPPGDYTWEYNCGDPREVEIIGAGMGSETDIDEPQSLTITDWGEVEDLWVQASLKDPGDPFYIWPSVNFSSSGPPVLVGIPNNTEAGWHYETDDLQPDSQITADVIFNDPPINIPRSFIAYLFREANPNPNTRYNTGSLPHEFVWNSGGFESKTRTFTIPQTTSTRDVTVTFAISDKRSSAEFGTPVLAEIKVEIEGAPSLTKTETYNEPTNGNQLLLDTITVNNVPGWATTVKVTVRSPDDGDYEEIYGPGSSGDSLYWSGVNVQTSCANLLGYCDSAVSAPANKFQACYYQFTGASPPPSDLGNYDQNPPPEYPLLNKEDETTTNFTYGPPPASRVQSTNPWAVDRNWPGEIDATGQSTNVVAVWRGSINFQSGIYDFFVETDDGAMVTVENINGIPGPSTIINGWAGSGNYSALNQMLGSGAKKVTLQWYNGQNPGSRIRFWWVYKPIQTEPWLQVNGDTHVQGDLYSNVHMSARYFSTGRALVSVKCTADFGGYGSMVAPDGKWLVNPYSYNDYSRPTDCGIAVENPPLYGYDYFDKQIEATPWPYDDTPTISELNSLTNTLTDTFYKIEGDLTLPNNVWTINPNPTRKLVILVTGNLTINNRIMISNTQKGNFLGFIVKGDISIGSGVSNGANSALNGVYIADGKIQTSATNSRLTVMGTYIGYGGLIFQRTWIGASRPTESFFYDPTLIMQAPFQLGRTPFVWQEIAP